MEETLDTQLPEDYYELIKNYGAGYFGGYFIIYNPFIEYEPLNLTFNLKENRYYYESAKNDWNMVPPGVDIKGADALLAIFESQRNENGKFNYCGDEFDNVGHPFSFFPEKDGLLPCGEYNGEYVIYWKTNADKWTVVVYHDNYYSEFNMSLTEFIYKLISKEIALPSLYEAFTSKGFVFEQYIE